MVYNDLNQNEIYNDISYTLETLTIIMNDVFNKINYRIINEKNKLDTIKLRINKCKLKVDEIRGSQNATTIFSTAKFPTSKILLSYPTLFSEIHKVKNILYHLSNYHHLLIIIIIHPLSVSLSSFLAFSHHYHGANIYHNHDNFFVITIITIIIITIIIIALSFFINKQLTYIL